MALPKQSIPINFSQGLDTKSDPFQVSAGRFLNLQNSVFTKAGLLQKRNGFGSLTTLPDSSSTFLTTFNGNLTAIGSNLEAFTPGINQWKNKGALEPVMVDTQALIRSNTNQVQADTAIAPNGLVCVVYTDNTPVAGTVTPIYKYSVMDSATGQSVVPATVIPVSSGAAAGSPRVFLLGNYFIIVFTNLISATNHLQYIAVSVVNPTAVTTNADISASYTPASTVAFDGIVVNNSLYLAWAGADVGGAIRVARLSSTLILSSAITFLTKTATVFSLTADTSSSTPVIYIAFYDLPTTVGYIAAVNQQLSIVHAPVQVISSGTVNNITMTATASVCKFFYEVANAYSYDSGIATNYIKKNTITQSGTVGTSAVLKRSVGLASKAVLIGAKSYFLTIYSSAYQPSYFLLDDSGNIVSLLASSNAGSYYTLGLPSVALSDTTIQFAYLYKDLVEAVNKTQGAANSAGIYAQTGINLGMLTIGSSALVTAEIAKDLHLTGGFLWMYDGVAPVEHGFFVWPDSVEISTSTSGGLITAQTYFYQAIYEWTDAQGNIFRSAPSVPVSIVTTGSTSTNTINIPTLRLTYKTATPVKIVLYRWSTANQSYYQVTSVANPTLNDPTVDSVAIIDRAADSSIVGNSLIYTTGGVAENTIAPPADTITLWQSRLFLLDAEDKDLIWFSKPVVESVPVEMSDLFTIYVAPTIGVNGPTGSVRALSPLDDKLIVFKQDAAYYIVGQGPDSTGANSQYSDPIFITATVGCSNQRSIVFIPQGLMFQSDKGIWLLGRDLATTYIGAAVEGFTQGTTVLSAVNVPGTNQVRFTLDSGITLMYDYFYGQWGTFTNVPALSSTIYQGAHTYLNSFGQIYQETDSTYLDGSSPVLMSFTTSWFNLAGLQGYERAYFFYLLATYYTPHKLQLAIAYDYESAPSQLSVITPDNYNPKYGNQTGPYGSGTPYGGNSQREQWRVFLQKQKCEAFQITLTEVYDPSFAVPAGAGFTLSGINLIVGSKKSYTTLKPKNSVG